MLLKKIASGGVLLTMVAAALAICSTNAVAAPESRRAAEVRALNRRVLQLHGALQSARSPEQRLRLGADAAVAIQRRAAALAALIAEEPANAVSLSFSPELLADLASKAPQVAGLLEAHTTLVGDLERWTADSPGLNYSRSTFLLKTSGATYQLHFAGQQPAQVTGSTTVEATGVTVGSAMAVSTTVVAPAATLTSGTSTGCSNTGVQNTAVLLVQFPDALLPAAVSAQSMADVFFGTSTGRSLDGFLREASHGATAASGNIFGPFTLGGTYASCSDVGSGVLNDAIAAATAGGANLQNYSRVFLVFPDKFGCGWAGYASDSCSIASTSGTFNASAAYLAAGYATTRDSGVELAAHEFGHNMGLLHSGTISAGSTVLGPLSSPGVETDLNDYFSTMGASDLGLYPAPQAQRLGWMTANTNYQVVQSSGTYTLQPVEISPPGLQALKVQRGTGNNAWLWIEYRQPTDSYDSTLSAQVFTGALVHYEDANTVAGHTYLPTFTPGDTYFFNPALSAGQTWTDAYTNLSLTVNSATPSGLVVSVNYGTAPCTHANPTVVMSPPNPAVYAGSAANYTVAVTNQDAAGCAPSTFVIASGQPATWSASLSTSLLTLNAGQTGSVTLTETPPPGTTPATYAVSASASSGSYASSGTANLSVMAAPALSVGLSVSSSSYTTRQTVSMTAHVGNGSALAGVPVNFTITEANGSTMKKTATTDSYGNAVYKYKLSAKDPKGPWSAIAEATYNGASATSNAVLFSVQ